MKHTAHKIDPKIKDILYLLGTGVFIAASLFIPSLPRLAKPILEREIKHQQDEWNKFNTWRLKQVLKRMHKQKLIEIYDKDGIAVVKINDRGRKRLLKYNLENIHLQKKKWDGKWRIIIYDILSHKKSERELFRRTLKKMNFFPLQKSVYLTPYSCTDEIEYLRQICDIGKEVVILTATGFENESVYKTYFGLN